MAGTTKHPKMMFFHEEFFHEVENSRLELDERVHSISRTSTFPIEPITQNHRAKIAHNEGDSGDHSKSNFHMIRLTKVIHNKNCRDHEPSLYMNEYTPRPSSIASKTRKAEVLIDLIIVSFA